MNQVCRYYQTGYCKHRSHCQQRHIDEICPNKRECKEIMCGKRHQKICRYFAKQSKCRFERCAYSHEKDESTIKIEFLERKIVELKCDIDELKKNSYTKTKTLSEQFCELNNSFVEVVKKVKRLEHDQRENRNEEARTELSQKVNATAKVSPPK